MAFKEIEYWASLINDGISQEKAYNDVCNNSIKKAKLNEAIKLANANEKVIDPSSLGFDECCNEDLDEDDVFAEKADPLKEKIDASIYLDEDDCYLDECQDNDVYSNICIKFNDQNEDKLSKYLNSLYSSFIDINCENMTDNSTDAPIYKLIGPLAQLKQLFASCRNCDCQFDQLPQDTKDIFNQHINTDVALTENEFFGFEDINASTANLVRPNEVQMSMVTETDDNQKKTQLQMQKKKLGYCLKKRGQK